MDIVGFFKDNISHELLESCQIKDGIVNKLEEAGIFTHGLHRALSSIQEEVEEEIKERRKSIQESEADEADPQGASEGKDDDDNEIDIDGLKYFEAVAKIFLTKLDDFQAKYGGKSNSAYQLNGKNVYMASDKHTKRTMEDRSIVVEDLGKFTKDPKLSGCSYFGVFDGHGGHEAAEFMKTYYHFMLTEYEEPDWSLRLSMALEDMDNAFLAKCQLEGSSSGSTALAAVIHQKTLYLSWLGDCEAHLVTKNNELVSLVKPHKLSDSEVLFGIHNFFQILKNQIPYRYKYQILNCF